MARNIEYVLKTSWIKKLSGKTGLLEAISFLSETRSFKKCDDKELINTKEKFASIEGTYEDGDYKHEINALIEEKGKTFILDDVKKKTTAQVIGNLIHWEDTINI